MPTALPVLIKATTANVAAVGKRHSPAAKEGNQEVLHTNRLVVVVEEKKGA